jgi:Ricin-type beta-trefoil lectin domain-like
MRRALVRAGLLVAVTFACCPSPDWARDGAKQAPQEPGADASPAPPDGDLAGVYAIICAKNLKCLDAPVDATGVNGTRPQLWRPNRQDNQRWEIRPVSGNRVKIVCATSGKVLDVESTQLRKQSAAVQLYDDLNGKNQLWELVPQGTASSRSAAALARRSSTRMATPLSGTAAPSRRSATWRPTTSAGCS